MTSLLACPKGSRRGASPHAVAFSASLCQETGFSRPLPYAPSIGLTLRPAGACIQNGSLALHHVALRGS